MQVRVTCPNCGKELKAPQELWGKRVACPSCSQSFRVGSPGETPPDSPVSGGFRVAPPPTDRRGQAAKFIVENAAETQLQLGADGRLPELRFEDIEEEDDLQQPEARDSNPLLLIGVLCFSVTLSVILLVFEPTSAPTNSASKWQARSQIQRHYLGIGPDLRPHERRLREALQAFHRGDTVAEQRLYREVLNMVKDESHRGAAGLTGPKTAQNPPNDRHLEEQLATLLSRD